MGEVHPELYRLRAEALELGIVTQIGAVHIAIEDQETVARLARRWAIFLEQRQKASGVCYVRYEDFFQDKVGCILDAAKQLDIACDRERLLQLCHSQASPP